MYFIGIDGGTESVRAAIFDRKGAALPRAARSRNGAFSPSLAIRTIGRVRECRAHNAPFVVGVVRVVGCNRYLARRLSRHVRKSARWTRS